jgi:hypothetical protein
MSNKSFSIKENPYMKDIQGGEKKVMKKILSVALSTAMAFSMFASVAFGADAEKLTPEQQFNVLKEAGIVQGYPDGMSHLDRTVTRAELAKIIVKSMALEEVTGVATYKDKNYTAKHWAAPFIESATKAGILKGVSTNPANPLFNPTGNVTVQELAKVLVEANKLEVPTEANNTASEWAKGYVAAAIKAGYIAEGINYQANATRAQTVVAAHAIYEFNNFKVTKAEAIDANNVKLTLSTGEVVEVKLEKALEANKATELTYKAKDGRELKYTVTYVVTAATKIESVTATNYKELTVKFDGDVDKKTAENKENYTISNVTFDSATLSSDKKEVKLLIAKDSPTTKLDKQKETTLVIKGVKNGNASKVFDEKVKFTAVDSQLPTVTEVKGLGTKAIKVVFSEPVTEQTARNMANYRIDGKAISGSVDYSYPNIAFISTDVAVGAHKLSVQAVEDFAEFKVTPTEIDFTVAEDTTAPEVVKVTSNDLKQIVVEFNEPVKSVKNAYHTSTSRKAKSPIKISDNKVTLDFEDVNQLSLNETTVTLEGVTDYSNNTADRTATVKPELDVTRPEVASVSSKVNDYNTDIVVEFTKDVKEGAVTKSNYVLRNEKGELVKVNGFNSDGQPISTIVQNTTKKVTISSIGKLAAGKYSLEVSGVRDTASVANILLPTKVDFSVVSDAALQADSAWYTRDADIVNGDTQIYVKFNRAVATSGNGNAEDINKYSYKTATSYNAFKADVATARLYSVDTVVITVPTKELKADFAGSELNVVNVSDVNGNFINLNAAKPTITDRNASAVKFVGAKVIDKKTVQFEFDSAMSYVNPNEFTVTGQTPGAKIDKITTDSSNPKFVNVVFDKDGVPADTTNLVFSIIPALNGTGSHDYYNRPLDSKASIKVEDTIRPSKTSDVTVNSGKLIVGFDEDLNVTNNPSLFTVNVNNQVLEISQVAVGTDTKTVELTVAAADVAKLAPGTVAKSGYVQYSPKQNLVAITDKKGNAAEGFDSSFVIAAVTAPTATIDTVATNDANTFTVTLNKASVVAVSTGAGTTATGFAPTPVTADTSVAIASTAAATTGQTVEFTVTHADGVSTYVATFNGTVWAIAVK